MTRPSATPDQDEPLLITRQLGASAMGIADEITKLHELYSAGLLNYEQYLIAKNKLLGISGEASQQQAADKYKSDRQTLEEFKRKFSQVSQDDTNDLLREYEQFLKSVYGEKRFNDEILRAWGDWHKHYEMGRLLPTLGGRREQKRLAASAHEDFKHYISRLSM